MAAMATTIQQTGKFWKALAALAWFGMAIGAINSCSVAEESSASEGVFWAAWLAVSILALLGAKAGSWWCHD